MESKCFVKNDLEVILNKYFSEYRSSSRANDIETLGAKARTLNDIPPAIHDSASERFVGCKEHNKNLQQFLHNNNIENFENKYQNQPATFKGYAHFSNDYRNANYMKNEGFPPKTTEYMSYSNYQNNNPIEGSVSHRYGNNNSEKLYYTRRYDAGGFSSNYKNEDQLRSNTMFPQNRGELRNDTNFNDSVNDVGTYKDSQNIEHFRNDATSRNEPQFGGNVGTFKPCGYNESTNSSQIIIGLVREEAEVVDDPKFSTRTGGEIGPTSQSKCKVNKESSTSIDDNKIDPKEMARKERSGYRRACDTLKRFMGRDPAALTKKERHMLSKQRSRVRSYERSYPNVMRRSDDNKEILLVGITPQSTAHTASAENKVLDKPIGKKVQGPNIGTYAAPRTSVGDNRGNGQGPVIVYGPSTSKAARDTSQPDSSRDNSLRVNVTKRNRSGEEPLVGSKKPHKKGRLETDPALRVAVIDRSDTNGRISPANWLKLEGKLMIMMLDDSKDRGEVRFCDVDWSKGVKIIDCANKQSLRFLKDAIYDVGEFWPGARLEVVPRSSIPLRPIVSLWVPPPVLAPGLVTKLLGKQNDGLNTQSWEVLSIVEGGKFSGLELKIEIDAASLEFLRARAGKLLLGFGNVRIRHPSINYKK